jgi:hypothetical protein
MGAKQKRLAGWGRSGSRSENEVFDISFASLVRSGKSDPSLPNLVRLAPIPEITPSLRRYMFGEDQSSARTYVLCITAGWFALGLQLTMLMVCSFCAVPKPSSNGFWRI